MISEDLLGGGRELVPTVNEKQGKAHIHKSVCCLMTTGLSRHSVSCMTILISMFANHQI